MMEIDLLKESKSFIHNCKGKWSFSYYTDYVLDINVENDKAIFKLYDEWECQHEELGLTLIKLSEFYVELFVECKDGNFILTLYPNSTSGCIGVEITYSEVFIKNNKLNKKLSNYYTFTSVGDNFPDWVNGIWKGEESSFSFAIQKIASNTLNIQISHQMTKNTKVISCGYIGHTGINFTLYHNKWCDKPIKCKLQFDYSNETILYVEEMMLPVQLS